jgi:hypothetical protein
VTAIEDPIEYEITIRSDTDHTWAFRRKDANGNVLMPTSARGQIRSEMSDKLWQELYCTINSDGWIVVTLPHANVEKDVWNDFADKGHWDLLVTYADKIYRWVEGPVINDVGVTNGY